MTYVLAYDIGTTGVKTCLFSLEGRITLLASAQEGYGLYLLEGGGAEQEPEEWWQAMRHTTRELVAAPDVRPEQIAGLSFCSPM
ncbi:MAG: carbohydrate kinase, partial [Oscillospiraceae bacterium]|nr:carbohydrate kinase [Oscillospiraceae bacterium]